MLGEIKTHMQHKSTDELLAIWTRNDRNEWSEDAFEAIKEVLTNRSVDIPAQDVPPAVQAKLDVGAQLKELPDFPLKKAIRIERSFAVWSFLLALWIFFGFFNIFVNFHTMNQYSTALSNVRMASSPLVSVKPEFEEAVKRLQPHLSALESLESYNFLTAVIGIPAWIVLFPIRKRFVQRRQQGPTYLLIFLTVYIVVHARGAFLTLPIPMADTMGFVDVFQIRVLPFAVGIIMLTLATFFGKTATVFCHYTAVDYDCFKKDGVGLNLLGERQGWPAQLSSLAVWSFILCPFPYVGLPMGICAVRAISNSEGRLHGKKLAWASVMVNVLLLAIMIFGIIIGVLGDK